MNNEEFSATLKHQLESSAGVDQVRAHVDSLWRNKLQGVELSDEQLDELIEIAQKALFDLVVVRRVQNR